VLVALVLFVLAFTAKRRFGLLGLALAAGSLLSGIWGYGVGLVIGGLGVPTTPLTSAIVLSTIILLPAMVLLLHGYTYKTFVGRIVGAGLFTLLALAFLIEPLGHFVMLQGAALNVYDSLIDNRTLIIGAGLIIAVIDIFLTKPVKLPYRRR
jgi:hypothetical protein